MFAVFTCIFAQHDLRLVAVAALICITACLSAFGFQARAQTAEGGLRWAWLALTGMVAGSGVWATHFLAMLAYQPALKIAFDLGETLASLTAAVVGISIPIPLFNNGSAFVAQSRSEQTVALAPRNLALIDTRQAIASAQTEVANAAATARAAGGPGLAAAQEAARIARIGWAQGKFDQIALLDAERTLSQTRQTYVDALAAYHDAQARLDRLTTPAPSSGDNR